MKEWTWYQAGLALAASFLLAVVLVKPIGVSTQFVILDGMVARVVQPSLVEADAAFEVAVPTAFLVYKKKGAA